MADVFSKHILSGSTNGRPIEITASSATGAITIHTAPTGTTGHDEVWLWAFNTATVNRQVVVRLGATTSGEALTQYVRPQTGMELLIPGQPFNNAQVITAYAPTTPTAGVLSLNGYINRIATSTATAT